MPIAMLLGFWLLVPALILAAVVFGLALIFLQSRPFRRRRGNNAGDGGGSGEGGYSTYCSGHDRGGDSGGSDSGGSDSGGGGDGGGGGSSD